MVRTLGRPGKVSTLVNVQATSERSGWRLDRLDMNVSVEPKGHYGWPRGRRRAETAEGPAAARPSDLPLIEELGKRLTGQYGQEFSVRNL